MAVTEFGRRDIPIRRLLGMEAKNYNGLCEGMSERLTCLDVSCKCLTLDSQKALLFWLFLILKWPFVWRWSNSILEDCYKFSRFCEQCHPSIAPDDADIQPRNVSWIHTCHLFMSQFCLYLHFRGPGIQIHRPKLPKYCSGKLCQLWGNVVIGLDCTASKTEAKLVPWSNLWLRPNLHPHAGQETHRIICQFLIAETCSIFLNWIY